MTTQPDIDAIAREAALELGADVVLATVWKDTISAAIRRALEPVEKQLESMAKGSFDASVVMTEENRLLRNKLSEMNYGESYTIAMLSKVAKAADELETLLRNNTGSNDDCPIEIKVSGDYVKQLADKLTALSRSLKPYRKKIK